LDVMPDIIKVKEKISLTDIDTQATFYDTKRR
jgi:hypothetical protein